MPEFTNRDDATAAVDAYMASWARGDVAAKAACLTDDFILWRNSTDTALNREQAIDYFRKMMKTVTNSLFDQVHRMLSPTGLVQQHLVSFDVDGTRHRDIPVMLIFTTRGSKVARCDLYTDTTGLPDMA